MWSDQEELVKYQVLGHDDIPFHGGEKRRLYRMHPPSNSPLARGTPLSSHGVSLWSGNAAASVAMAASVQARFTTPGARWLLRFSFGVRRRGWHVAPG